MNRNRAKVKSGHNGYGILRTGADEKRKLLVCRIRELRALLCILFERLTRQIVYVASFDFALPRHADLQLNSGVRNEKAKELATYARLKLDRRHKFKRRREAEEARRLHRFIGGTSPERPWLRVPWREYEQTWQEVAQELKFSEMAPELRDLMRVRLENEVYDRLASQAAARKCLEEAFYKTHGRAMTTEERAAFARLGDACRRADSPAGRAQTARQILSFHVLEKIRERQESNPQRLQSIWAEIVGPDLALQTTLEGYDAARGLAFCSTVNPSAAYPLRRRTDLTRLLSQALGISIRRIVFK